MMFRVLALVAVLSLQNTVAWTFSPTNSRFTTSRNVLSPRVVSRSALHMALDYNDPVVAEEFGNVQMMDFDDVEAELFESGIPVPPMANDMDAKLMLVEVRLRKTGRMPGSAKKEEQTTFSSEYEKIMYQNPVFKEYIRALEERGDINSKNVAVEYVNDPKSAKVRYGEDYKSTIRDIERAMKAPPPVLTKSLSFSGFPANMGEMGCKMTLEAIGEIVSFECEESDDFPILTGTVEFEDIEDAKKAVEQYNGMDMGMGTALKLQSV